MIVNVCDSLKAWFCAARIAIVRNVDLIAGTKQLSANLYLCASLLKVVSLLRISWMLKRYKRPSHHQEFV
jgi:hypothetical protein